jgi:ubiquinone/menaquinone biosynthesis C-methylase UbiE
MKVLDIGCGTAMVAKHLLDRGGSYFGTDHSEEMLQDCHLRIGDMSAVYLASSEMDFLPLPDASFDYLLCPGALEYSNNIRVTIKELSRVIKEKGILIFSMQNKASIYRLCDIYVYRSDIINSIKTRLGFKPTGQPLEMTYPPKALQEMLQSYHLKVTDICYYDFSLWLRPLDNYFPRLLTFLSKMLEFLCNTRLRMLATNFLIKTEKSQ